MEKQELIAAYKNFLDKGKTERECVAEIIKTAEKYVREAAAQAS